MSDPSAVPAAEPAPPVPAPVPESGPVAAIEALEAEAQETVVSETEDTRPFITVRDEKFHISAEIPAFVQVKLAAAADPRTSGPKQMSAIQSFLQAIVVDEESDTFTDLLENARPIIGFEEFEKIMTDATEALNGRPTSQ